MYRKQKRNRKYILLIRDMPQGLFEVAQGWATYLANNW